MSPTSRRLRTCRYTQNSQRSPRRLVGLPSWSKFSRYARRRFGIVSFGISSSGRCARRCCRPKTLFIQRSAASHGLSATLLSKVERHGERAQVFGAPPALFVHRLPAQIHLVDGFLGEELAGRKQRFFRHDAERLATYRAEGRGV